MSTEEWIEFEYGMPKLNQEVEVILKDGETRKAELTFSHDGLRSDLCFYESENKRTLDSYAIMGWRPLQEKRPDFSKLERDNAIIIEADGKKYFMILSKIEPGNLYGTVAGWGYINICQNNITKITRINIEEQKFEEI